MWQCLTETRWCPWDLIAHGNWDKQLYSLKFVGHYAVYKFLPRHLYWQGGRPSASGSGMRMKGLATWRAATRTHAFRETEDSPLFQLLFGSECGCTLISILLVTTRMNYSLVSNASFKLHTEDMSNFQPFFRKERGSQFEFLLWFSLLDPCGKECTRQSLCQQHWFRSHSCPLPWRDVEIRSTLFKISNI